MPAAAVDIFEKDPTMVLEARARAKSGQLPPEKKLMVAVLDVVIADLKETAIDGYAEQKRGIAEDWVRAQASDWPFGFEAICDALGLSIEATRRALLEMLAESRRVVGIERAKRKAVGRQGA